MGGQQLGHVVVDGIPGQTEFCRQLLAVGVVVPEIAQNLKPGLIRQQANGVVHIILRTPGGVQSLLDALTQDAAVYLHRSATLRGHGQVGVQAEEEGVNPVVLPAPAGQGGGLSQKLLRPFLKQLPGKGGAAGGHGLPVLLQEIQHRPQQGGGRGQHRFRPVIQVQNGHLAFGGNGQSQNPGGKVVAGQLPLGGGLLADFQGLGQVPGQTLRRPLPGGLQGMGQIPVKFGYQGEQQQKGGTVAADGIVGETGQIPEQGCQRLPDRADSLLLQYGLGSQRPVAQLHANHAFFKQCLVVTHYVVVDMV